MAKTKKPDEMTTTEKNLGGQPTKFREEFIQLAYNYCLLGATVPDLAKFFDVTETTIHNWSNAEPRFFDALKAGKGEADAQVAKSLYHRALGYSHPETVIHNHNGKIIKTDIVKHYPPDTTACIFWLKNRQSGKWRDKVEVSAEVKLTKSDLQEIEQNFIDSMEKAKARQQAVLIERGLPIDEEPITKEKENGSKIKE